jgi:hypothetical protein
MNKKHFTEDDQSVEVPELTDDIEDGDDDVPVFDDSAETDYLNHNPSPKKISIAERRLMALELRKQGGTYRSIAEQLRNTEGVSDKYNGKQAYVDVKTVLNEIATQMSETAKDVLTLELERLDDLWVNVYEWATQGDTPSLHACLSIMDRRTRLLGIGQNSRRNELDREADRLERMSERELAWEYDQRRREAAREDRWLDRDYDLEKRKAHEEYKRQLDRIERDYEREQKFAYEQRKQELERERQIMAIDVEGDEEGKGLPPIRQVLIRLSSSSPEPPTDPPIPEP